MTFVACPTMKKINWSLIARNHGLTNKNGGQIVKEVAEKN